MTKKYFADSIGRYIGCFDCGALEGEPRDEWFVQFAPNDAIEVFGAPDDARAIWNGQSWDEPSPKPEQSLIQKFAALEAALVLKGIIVKDDLDADAVQLKSQ